MGPLCWRVLAFKTTRLLQTDLGIALKVYYIYRHVNADMNHEVHVTFVTVMTRFARGNTVIQFPSAVSV